MPSLVNAVTIGAFRLSRLTRSTIRIEFSPGNRFEDRPSLRALTRPDPIPFDSQTEIPGENTIELRAGKLVVRVQKNSVRIDGQSLSTYWMTSENETRVPLWKPGQVDHRNLGGVHLSMDVLQRGTIAHGVHPAGPQQRPNDERWQMWSFRRRMKDSSHPGDTIGDAMEAARHLLPEEILAVVDREKLPTSFIELIEERAKFPPGLLSSSGYYVHDDSGCPVVLRPGSIDEELVPRDGNDEDRDLYLFAYDPDAEGFAAALLALRDVFGPTPLLPRFSLGLWYSRYPTFDQDGCIETMERFKKEGIPLDMMVLDLEWHMRGWFGFDWDLQHIPDPDALMKRFRDEGVHTTFNVHPGAVPVNDSGFDAFIKAAGLEQEGASAIEAAQSGMRNGHHTSPDEPLFSDLRMNRPRHHRAYLETLHHPVQDQGLDFWWLDGHAPVDKGLEGSGQMWTNEVYVTHARHRYPGRRPLTFTRYPGLGSHRYPFHFSGDTIAHFEVLENQVEQTLRAGHMALCYLTHDIGGHINHSELLDPELYARWCQWGFLSPIFRLHSSGGGERRPWMYARRIQDGFRTGFRWRYTALPYLYTVAFEAHDRLMPPCRSNVLTRPQWREGRDRWDAFFLGDRIYAAPVVRPGFYREVLLPEGEWMSMVDGRIHDADGKSPFNQIAHMEQVPNHYLEAGRVHARQCVSSMPQAHRQDQTIVLDYIRSSKPANDTWSLYEDDGVTLDHAKGGCSTRKIHSRQDVDGHLRITIEESTGAFHPPFRMVELRLIGYRPESVVVNGVQVAPEADGGGNSYPALPAGVVVGRYKLGNLSSDTAIEIMA